MVASDFIIILLLLVTFIMMGLENRYSSQELADMGISLENSCGTGMC